MGHTVQVDEAFVQAPEHRPKTVISEADGIPLIDLSPLSSEGVGAAAVPPALLAQVEAACRDWGFFQVMFKIVLVLCTNHGTVVDLD